MDNNCKYYGLVIQGQGKEKRYICRQIRRWRDDIMQEQHEPELQVNRNDWHLHEVGDTCIPHWTRTQPK